MSAQASTEAPSFLEQNLDPVKLRYVPLPSPLSIPSNPRNITATESMHGHPCRRCLQGALPGESVYLVSYDPFPVDSETPYRGEGPIFLHTHDCQPFNGDRLPQSQLGRQMSLRAYDENHMLAAAEVIGGDEFEMVAGQMLADSKAAYVNVHNAKPGCFAVRVERAD